MILISSLFLGGCASKKQDVVENQVPAPKTIIHDNIKGGATVLPNATIFKMNGDYANNVAVTVNADGVLIYFPAPTDLTANSAPYDLGNGWYLNRQGIGANSVFTKYTFDEYRSLTTAPSPAEIKAAIIPGSRVTVFQELPIKASEAISNPDLCLPYLK